MVLFEALFHISDPYFQILYQSLGFIALIFCVLSFQFKKKETFMIIQCISSIFFAVQFLLGSAWVAFMMNCLCILRALIFYFIKKKEIIFSLTFVICIAFLTIALISIFMFNEKIFIASLCFLGSVAGTISYLFTDKKYIRIIQISIVSPCWLVNNIFYFSLGAIIAESLNIVFSIVALLRWKYFKKNIG